MTAADPHPADLPRCCRRHPSKSPRAGIRWRNCVTISPRGTDVTITFLPGDNYRHNVETAAALRRAGFNPVPHIAAREMASREALDDFLARARGEADVYAHPADRRRRRAATGPFKSSLDVCASGLIETHGIASVSVAGHPEGHPFLETAETLERARGVAAMGTAERTSRSTSSRNSASRARRSSPGSANSTRAASSFR